MTKDCKDVVVSVGAHVLVEGSWIANGRRTDWREEKGHVERKKWSHSAGDFGHAHVVVMLGCSETIPLPRTVAVARLVDGMGGDHAHATAAGVTVHSLRLRIQTPRSGHLPQLSSAPACRASQTRTHPPENPRIPLMLPARNSHNQTAPPFPPLVGSPRFPRPRV